MSICFSGTIESARGGGHLVPVPAEVAAALPGARPPVVALVNDVPYRSRLMVYGGQSYLGLRLELLRTLGVSVGDEVRVELSEDLSPRVVEEPVELTEALAGTDAARAAYDALAFSHRREFARWVGEAKKPETRTRRAAETVHRLLQGQVTTA